jgi:hypothetical protein
MTRHLPIVGSSAASTAFVSARIDGPGGKHLYLDGNGKVTAGNGTFDAPKPNAFSLRNVEDCPQSTPTCREACYVDNLRGAQPELWAMYEHNARSIREILAEPALADAWVLWMAKWITVNAGGGFRWHVSGDVFSLEYARWVADVVRESAPVLSWLYTRSFDFLGPLAEVSTLRKRPSMPRSGGNLVLNLSCDQDNYWDARKASLDFGDAKTVPCGDSFQTHFFPLRLCYLTVDGAVPTTLPEGSVIFPDYSLRPRQFDTLAESPWWASLTPAQRKMVCPVDAHGKAETRRCGPCQRCLT